MHNGNSTTGPPHTHTHLRYMSSLLMFRGHFRLIVQVGSEEKEKESGRPAISSVANKSNCPWCARFACIIISLSLHYYYHLLLLLLCFYNITIIMQFVCNGFAGQHCTNWICTYEMRLMLVSCVSECSLTIAKSILWYCIIYYHIIEAATLCACAWKIHVHTTM